MQMFKPFIDLNQWIFFGLASMSFKNYQLAAEQGDALAQNSVGLCLCNGKGTPKNLPLSIVYFERSAGQGSAVAQYNLGACYYNGAGVEKNPDKARTYMESAAKQGHVKAKQHLSA